MRCRARVGSREFAIEVVRRGGGVAVRVDGAERRVEVRGSGALFVLTVDGRTVEAAVAREGTEGESRGEERSYGVTIGGRFYPVVLGDALRRPPAAAGARREGRVEVRATMPGRITALLVREGQEVRAGGGLVVVEAMKMENEITAPKDGRISSVKARAGEAVETGALLVTID